MTGKILTDFFELFFLCSTGPTWGTPHWNYVDAISGKLSQIMILGRLHYKYSWS